MTGEEARNLKAGDYVSWNLTMPVEIGVITNVNQFGVTIRWADGRLTSALFNDMKRMSHIDVNGRIIAP